MINTELAQRLKEINDSQDELQNQSKEIRRFMEKQKELEDLMEVREGVEKEIEELTAKAEGVDSIVQRKRLELTIAQANEKRSQVVERQESLEKELLAMTVVIQKNKNFDKWILFNNIRELLRSSDVKLGQIEKEAGCQPGYMSRLEKSGNTTDPSIEFVVTAAKMLSVPIDLLIHTDVGIVTPTEEYLLQFLKGLIDDTRSDDILWEKESVTMLQHIEPLFEIGSGSRTTHPLFKYQQMKVNETEYEDDIFYDSQFYPRETVRIVDSSYHAELMSTAAKIYIMACKKGIAKELANAPLFYEVYLVKGEEVIPICCSLDTGTAVSGATEALYKEIEVAAAHVHLNYTARAIISSYLEERKLPFE